MSYWDITSDGDQWSAYEAFPDVSGEDEIGLAHQIIAINEKLTDRPKKVYFIKKTLVKR